MGKLVNCHQGDSNVCLYQLEVEIKDRIAKLVVWVDPGDFGQTVEPFAIRNTE